MTPFNRNAPKKNVNLTLNADLIERLRSRGVNLSALMEAAGEQLLLDAMRQEFKAEVRRGFELTNQIAEEIGDLTAAALAFEADDAKA